MPKAGQALVTAPTINRAHTTRTALRSCTTVRTRSRPRRKRDLKEARSRSKVSALSAGPMNRSKNTLQEGMTLDAAVAHVKSIDTKAPFDGKDDMASSLPSVASSVAACVIRFGAADSPNRD